MKERLIVSAATMLTSLGAYLYAKDYSKDAIPYVMIGGFVGAVVGEAVANMISTKREKLDSEK